MAMYNAACAAAEVVIGVILSGLLLVTATFRVEVTALFATTSVARIASTIPPSKLAVGRIWTLPPYFRVSP
jgi:hypothetical protein